MTASSEAPTSAASNGGVAMKENATTAAAAHSSVTLELAKKESAEHMEGMKELYDYMRNKPWIIKAYALDDPNAPKDEDDDEERSKDPLIESDSSDDDEAASNAKQRRRMVKTFHFVRHGQGFHNLMADLATSQGREWVQFQKSPNNPYTMPEVFDAPLTEKGRQQAYLLQPRVEAMERKPNMVVFSPNCRALQTGLIVFDSLIDDPDVRFVAHEMAREECGVHVCDQRRPISKQRREFPQIDFSLVERDDEDPLFRHDRRETKMEVGQRIYDLMEWIADETRRTEDDDHADNKCVAISSHSGWLLTVFNGILDCGDNDALKQWFQTGEMRSVKLEFIPNPNAGS